MNNNRFVFDTNTLVSAFIFEESLPASALKKVREEGVLIASLETFKEINEVLFRPKLDKYLSLDKRKRLLSDLKGILIFFEIIDHFKICRDPKDDKFLELAVAASASCIISGDSDLLVLHPFRGIPILKASEFLDTHFD